MVRVTPSPAIDVGLSLRTSRNVVMIAQGAEASDEGTRDRHTGGKFNVLDGRNEVY
jgi:hypothetical protein